MDNKNVVEYYDNLIAGQLESGVNDRIYHLYKRLLRLGLNLTQMSWNWEVASGP